MRFFYLLIFMAFGISLKAQTCSVFVDDVADCGLNCGGSATAYATGQAPFTYLWQPNGQTTQQITSLCAGTYTVTVTDSLGCVASDSVTIIGSPILNVWISSIITPSCIGCSDGSATGSVSGGTPPYYPFWIPPVGQGLYTVNNIAAGTYTFCVTDANGCTSCTDTVLQDPLTISEYGLIDYSGDCELYSLTGVLVWQGKYTERFVIASALNGIYILVFKDKNGIIIQRQKVLLIGY